MNINRVILRGQLGHDAEVKELASGSIMVRFNLATNIPVKKFNGTEEVDTQWHKVVAWGGTAELARTLKKGQLVYVEGRIVHRSYQNAKNEVLWSTEIIASEIRP